MWWLFFENWKGNGARERVCCCSFFRGASLPEALLPPLLFGNPSSWLWWNCWLIWMKLCISSKTIFPHAGVHLIQLPMVRKNTKPPLSQVTSGHVRQNSCITDRGGRICSPGHCLRGEAQEQPLCCHSEDGRSQHCIGHHVLAPGTELSCYASGYNDNKIQ